MKIRKLLVLFLAIGLMFANCFPLAVYAEETTTVTTSDGGDVNSTGLIESYSLSLSGSYAMTSGTHTLTVTYLGYSGGLTMYTS